MDKKQSSAVQVGNFDMGECFCEVKCRFGHKTRFMPTFLQRVWETLDRGCYAVVGNQL